MRPLDDLTAFTTSGPGWTTILTGVWPSRHGVATGSMEGARIATNPSIFARLRATRPDGWTASIASYPPINSVIVSGADLAPTFTAEPASYADADAATVSQVTAILGRVDPLLLFVYLGRVDESGHRYGFRPECREYRDAIAAVDRQVGTILQALRARRCAGQEDWLVIVTSDHGGLGLTHGYREDPPVEIVRSFLVVSGPAVPRGIIDGPTGLVDVVPTVLAHLGVALDPGWALPGRPLVGPFARRTR